MFRAAGFFFHLIQFYKMDTPTPATATTETPQGNTNNAAGLRPEELQAAGLSTGPALVREGAQLAPAYELKEGETELKLRAGIAIMRQSKGRDVRNAQRIADGDGSKMGAAMLCICTTLNGRGLTIEEFDELHGADALLLFGEFNEKNA